MTIINKLAIAGLALAVTTGSALSADTSPGATTLDDKATTVEKGAGDGGKVTMDTSPGTTTTDDVATPAEKGSGDGGAGQPDSGNKKLKDVVDE